MAGNEQGLFSDIEFEKACDELDVPDVSGWEHFVESQGVKIYRLYDETSGLYQYKIFGELDDVPPDVCAKVYMDLEYRKEWDSYAKELFVKECEGRNLIYWNINFPFPLWNRDYVFGREYREMEQNGRKVWAVLAKSIETPSVPERKGLVRVSDYLQSAVMCSNGKQGSRAFMKYFDNPGGNIPTWLINWAAKTGVPQFLTTMHKACRGYPDFLKKKEQQQKSS
ncbi:phosphatidylcholine transfer protein [Aplysia californica]|uniref:Phosphatidylcholine transfer protein n=1 Tax=Aplysia californica TaxID=6500 RepID=A0ABM0JSM4_APLCA|nr:phosphatidylcholine transfer protein [Aplysia californica]XP_012939172.1 phosphatidylcholine transfer protein [Aplysia californica]